ncbi:hypothetical protein GQ607_008303 [Colletotrichum asianum]|nr:hypothetical protein GQ607_008303 [Colletotrichum asianum]
MIIFLLL